MDTHYPTENVKKSCGGSGIRFLVDRDTFFESSASGSNCPIPDHLFSSLFSPPSTVRSPTNRSKRMKHTVVFPHRLYQSRKVLMERRSAQSTYKYPQQQNQVGHPIRVQTIKNISRQHGQGKAERNSIGGEEGQFLLLSTFEQRIPLEGGKENTKTYMSGPTQCKPSSVSGVPIHRLSPPPGVKNG